MANITLGSSTDGPRITVNALVRDPRVIPMRMLNMIDQKFIAEKVLRQAGDAPGGTVRYFESSPLYANKNPENIAEFGDIPFAQADFGKLRSAHTIKKGLGVRVSEEMRRRNNIDMLNKQIDQVRNSTVQLWDATFMGALDAAVTQEVTASGAWSAGTADVRRDIANAIQTITDTRRGYTPNTLLISPTTWTDFVTSDDVAKTYQGNVADQNPLLNLRMPQPWLGLDIFVSYSVGDDEAFVMERNTVGGYVDERGLQATPLREEPRNESYWSALLRQSAVFIDEPMAACRITGV